MPTDTNTDPDEELAFYRNIVEESPALIGIQQMDDLSDPATNHNFWFNRRAMEFIGYSREEIDRAGHMFFDLTMHPDDVQMIGKALAKVITGESDQYGGVYRLKPKDGEFRWVIGVIRVFQTRDGMPWRFLNFSFEMDSLKDTQEQIIALTRENQELRSRIRLNALSKRERQIVGMIAAGHTDREIAGKLFISPTTAKTHRNNIHRKLGLKNNAALVRFAFETGLAS